MLSLNIHLQALMDSNLPRLQLELYKEIKKVICVIVGAEFFCLILFPCKNRNFVIMLCYLWEKMLISVLLILR